MEAAPGLIDRPVVIIGGFFDPGFAASALKCQFESVTRGQPVVAVSLWGCWSLEACRCKVMDAVARALPRSVDDRDGTIAVDVIGYSLGGLAARYAALDLPGAGPELRIHRLFAISSPLDGADDACRWPALLPIQKELRPDSTVLLQVNSQPAAYLIYAYVRLGDRPVGVANAAPPGQRAWWVSTPPFSDPHNGAYKDPRILADIARRLRGEPPLATMPPAPAAREN